jgi:hypothetical protein
LIKVIVEYLNNYYFPEFSSWDHTSWILDNFPTIFKDYNFPSIKNSGDIAFSRYLIVRYLLSILSSPLYVDKNYNFNTTKFYYDNYLHNCDVWGTCSIFFFIILNLQRSSLENKNRIINAYQDMLWNYIIKDGSLKIDVNGLFDTGGYIDQINSIIQLDDSTQQPIPTYNLKTTNKIKPSKSSKRVTKKTNSSGVRRSERIKQLQKKK